MANQQWKHLSPRTGNMEDCEGPDRCPYRDSGVPHALASDTAAIETIMAEKYGNGNLLGSTRGNVNEDPDELKQAKAIIAEKGASSPVEGVLAQELGLDGNLTVNFPPTEVGTSFAMDDPEGERRFTVTGSDRDNVFAYDSIGNKHTFSKHSRTGGPFTITSIPNTVAAHNEVVKAARGRRVTREKSLRDFQNRMLSKHIRDTAFDEYGAASGGINPKIKYNADTDTFTVTASRDYAPRAAVGSLTVDRTGDIVDVKRSMPALESALKQSSIRKEMRRLYECERRVAVAQRRSDYFPTSRLTQYPTRVEQHIKNDVKSLQRDRRERQVYAGNRVKEVLSDYDSTSSFKIGKDEHGIYVTKTDMHTGEPYVSSGYINTNEAGMFTGLSPRSDGSTGPTASLKASLKKVSHADMKELVESYNAPEVTRDKIEHYYPKKTK